jgi:hypothetical protein
MHFPQSVSSYCHFDNITHVFSHENACKIARAAQKTLCKLGTALAINIAFRYIFTACLIPHSTVVLTVCAFALSIYVITLVAQRCLAHKKVHLFLNDVSRSTWVNALSLKLNHLIHEKGHAFAASLSFIDASPEIAVTYSKGSTTYAISNGLTRFGTFLGEQRALLFITAAGLFSPIFCTVAEFALAHGIADSYPNLSEILTDHGFSQLAETLLYGASAYFTSPFNFQHDFIKLWQLGNIHPAVMLSVLLVLPLAEYCLLNAYKQINDPPQKIV